MTKLAKRLRIATMFQVTVFTIAILSNSAGPTFAGLAGHNWSSDENFVRVIGKSSHFTSNTKLCSALPGKIDCKAIKPGKPDYYLLECNRERSICDGVQAVILSNGEPWLSKVEYRISEWNSKNVSAIMNLVHPCVVTSLQIDLDRKEVVFTETYIKSIKDDPICLPENVGHITTYKLENY